MKKIIIAFLGVLTLMVGVILFNNDFDMTLKEDIIIDGNQKIAVAYAQPKETKEKPGLILFIHGDGPANKSSDEGYYPAWETLANENFISISWDKAGVGQSTGNWLDQDMDDRKAEAEQVLVWALKNLDVDPEKVGVWGASQGGWVISKLLNNNPDVKFAIGVAPAVNWLRQGKYNTMSEMTNEGYSQEEIDEKIAIEEKINHYLKQNDYQGYLDSKLDDTPLEEDRWDFIRKNMRLDNIDELAKINKPYYLIVGDHDSNVDTKETEAIYRKQVSQEYLKVYPIKNGTHRMLKPRHQKDNILTVVESVINPREIFAPAYLDALKEVGTIVTNL